MIYSCWNLILIDFRTREARHVNLEWEPSAKAGTSKHSIFKRTGPWEMNVLQQKVSRENWETGRQRRDLTIGIQEI